MLWTQRDSVQRYSREDGMADSAMAADAGKKRSHIPDANMWQSLKAFNLDVRRNEVFTTSIAHDQQRFDTSKTL